MDEKPIPSNIEELFHLRMLLLLECGDNKFRQVSFTKDEFDLITDFIFKVAGRPNPFGTFTGQNSIGLMLKSDWTKESDEFIGLQDHYREEKP